jgi:hypothetical protein
MNSQIHPSMGPGPIRWLRVAATLAGITLVAALAPVIWSAVKAGLGLIALATLAAGSWTVLQALPWAAQRLENSLLKARKAEAGRNPIEQLQNELMRRAGRLQEFKKALASVGTQIENIESMLHARKERDPSHSLQRQRDALGKLRQFHQINMQRLLQAHSALDDFRCTVERKDSEWQIAVAIDAASAVLDPHSQEHLLQDLLTDTALRSVQDRFNAVFAELDLQLLDSGAPTRQMLMDADRPGALNLFAIGQENHTP